MHLLKEAIKLMNQKTIAEIRSFEQPKQTIVDTMIVTFLLLGTPPKEIKNWKSVRGLIGKMGRESLKKKISNFTLAGAQELPKKVVREAQSIMASIDIGRVVAVSKATATFYSWCSGVLEELNSKN